MFEALLDEDATTLAALIRNGEVSARELTQAALDRMEKREPLIRAFCTASPELALQQASVVDAKRARGEALGAFAGVPLAVKDLICTAGVKTTSGSAAYADFIPEDDDITVERLLAADAVLLGKTTAPEFGYSGVGHNPLFPSPRNPWDLSKTPGGSPMRTTQMRNWLSNQLTSAKQSSWMWSGLAEILQSGVTAYVDPMLDRLHNRKSIFTMNSEDLDTQVEELGSFFYHTRQRCFIRAYASAAASG